MASEEGYTYEERIKQKAYPTGEGKIIVFYNEYKNVPGLSSLKTKNDADCIETLFKKQLFFDNDVVICPNFTFKQMKIKLEEQCTQNMMGDYQFLMIFFSGHGGSRELTLKDKTTGVSIMRGRYDFIYDSAGNEVPTNFLADFLQNNCQAFMAQKPKVLFLDCCREDSKSKFGEKLPQNCSLEIDNGFKVPKEMLSLKKLQANDALAEELMKHSGNFCIVRTTLPTQWAWDDTATKKFCEIVSGNGQVKKKESQEDYDKHSRVMSFQQIVEKMREELIQDHRDKLSEAASAGKLMSTIQGLQIVILEDCLVWPFYLGFLGEVSGFM